MKRKLIFATALGAICAIIFFAGTFSEALTPREVGGLDSNEPGAAIYGDINAKRAVVEQHLTFRNKSGSAMAQGEPVEIDPTSIEVVAATTAADDMTIAESLASEGGIFHVMVSWSGDQGSALTGTLTGTDQDGNAQTETITSGTLGRCVKASKIWSSITQADFANMSSNVGVYAYPYSPITDASSDEVYTIGLVTETIADNAEGSVATSGMGVVTLALVMGPAVIPGDILSANGSQALDEDGTAPYAIALEPAATQTAELIRVLPIWGSTISGLTASVAELNILDGATLDVAEMNLLDGVTSTTAELNILDGVTSTFTELNILDGVTADKDELNKLDGATATVAELNLTDNMAASIAFEASAGGANVCEVICDIYDAAGSLIAAPFTFEIWLSDASTGIGLTGTTASGTVTVKSASGAVLGTLAAKKALTVQTLGTGKFTLEITDDAKTQFYVGAKVPGTGATSVSTQLQTVDYGS
jgi:hypothetical protein